MRYEVWKWDSDEMVQYDEDYGEGAYERDSQKAGCYGAITQYGTLVKETDNEDEALKASSDVFDAGYSYFSGEVSIWDNEEHFWFN